MPQRDPAPSAVQGFLAGGVTRLVGILPRRVCLAAGRGTGRLAGALARRKRDRIISSLTLAGSADPEASAREAWGHLGATFAEMLWMTSRSVEEVLRHMEIEGIESFHEAGAGGRGVLMVVAHVANWELVGLAASRAGAPVAVIARPMRAVQVERSVVGFRERCGIRTLMRGKPGVSVAAVRHLKQGGILGCMMDRLSGGTRVTVPFLGRATNMPLGPLQLASRTGAALVVGCAHRRPDDRTVVSFRHLPAPPGTPAVELASIVGTALDAEVRKAPEQWLWIYRRQPSI